MCWLAVLPGCGWKSPTPDGSGSIECTEVQVASEVGGRLAKLLPEEGAQLKKGEVVAQIDPAEHTLRRDEAKAVLAQAQAQLELIQAGARAEDIARASEQVREAKVVAEAAAADLRRIREVFEQKSASPKQFDDAKAAAERAGAVGAAAEQNLAKLKAGNRPEEIRVAQSQVEVARARLAIYEKALADCTVVAPLDGVVTVRSRENGEMVNPGTPLLTVSRLEEVWLSVYVPETRLAQVKLGQSARVKLDGVERFFEGTVTFVSPEAEFTPKNVQTPAQRAKLVYRVKITLRNPDGWFKPGMPADGYLTQTK